MATWITHLRLAENLLAEIDGLDPSYFSLGNLAPDSGIPDEKWETFDPPTQVTHFQNPPESDYPSGDLAFYGGYLTGWKHPGADPRQFSFLLGYFFHLVTDNLWYIQIDQSTRARHADAFQADPQFIWEIKRDWYGLDFIYLRNHPDSLFWNVFSLRRWSFLRFSCQRMVFSLPCVLHLENAPAIVLDGEDAVESTEGA